MLHILFFGKPIKPTCYHSYAFFICFYCLCFKYLIESAQQLDYTTTQCKVYATDISVQCNNVQVTM